MNPTHRRIQVDEHSTGTRRQAWGNGLIYFCVAGLAIRSIVKFLHPPNAVAYMVSLGYQAGDLFPIGCLELLTAIVFCLRWTRPLGLLLVSSYLGGAIAAHVASHPLVAGGPGMTYLLTHPSVGVLPAAVFLLSAWTGTWLRHPDVLRGSSEDADGRALPDPGHWETARASRS
jgi:hypothetical protein